MQVLIKNVNRFSNVRKSCDNFDASSNVNKINIETTLLHASTNAFHSTNDYGVDHMDLQ